MERIFIVTAKRYVELVKLQLPELPERNIIIEPVGKNTAPCIGLSAFIIDKYYKDATIAVLPSDHLIKDEDKFREILNAANEFIENSNDAIVTIGMKPDRPETGYGYINYGEVFKNIGGLEIRNVKKFVEKPNIDTAKKYLQSGNFLWNGGMFIWKTSTILKLTRKHLNETYEILREIAATDDDEFEVILDKKYNDVESISVDYGIMEKAENIYVIPSDFGWDDVGSWLSLSRYRQKDKFNNVHLGDVEIFNGKNNIIVSSSKPIVIADLDNIIAVESNNIIFISSSKTIDNIKNIKNTINEQ